MPYHCCFLFVNSLKEFLHESKSQCVFCSASYLLEGGKPNKFACISDLSEQTTLQEQKRTYIKFTIQQSLPCIIVFELYFQRSQLLTVVWSYVHHR